MTTLRPLLALLALLAGIFSTHAQTKELRLPEIPGDMPRSDRPAFVVEHFWDGLEATDTALVRDKGFMELNTANFLYLLPYAPAEAREKGFEKVVEKLSADPASLEILALLLEKYLGDPASPSYSDFNYTIALRQLKRVGDRIPGLHIWLDFQFEMLLKNSPGSQATDFLFSNAWRMMRLSEAVDRPALLIFFDPECERCISTLLALKDMFVKPEALQNKFPPQIIAICIERNREKLESIRNSLPAEWTVGCDETDVVGSDLYYLPSLPAIYLLDSSRRVVLKNATLEEAVSALKSL